MTPDELRDLVRLTSNQSEQRKAAAMEALNSALGGVEELKKFGLFCEIVMGSVQDPQEWPKMVYHQPKDGEATKPPAVVGSEDELKGLGEGWSTEQSPGGGSTPEPFQPTVEHTGLVTDPTLVPREGFTAAAPTSGATMPPPPEASLSDEALGEAREAGKQAKLAGQTLEDAPQDSSADAWRQGFTEEAAWQQHESMQSEPLPGAETAPPTA